MSIHPIDLDGPWDDGVALDYHVISAVMTGYYENGREIFDTTRSELGEMLFQLKYRNQQCKVTEIINYIEEFIRLWTDNKNITAVLPVPPTRDRQFQPVQEIAKKISELIGAEYVERALIKTSNIEQKGLNPSDKCVISGTITQISHPHQPNNILIVDDLISTGSTLKECVKVLRKDPNIRAVYVLVLTKTKRG